MIPFRSQLATTLLALSFCVSAAHATSQSNCFQWNYITYVSPTQLWDSGYQESAQAVCALLGAQLADPAKLAYWAWGRTANTTPIRNISTTTLNNWTLPEYRCRTSYEYLSSGTWIATFTDSGWVGYRHNPAGCRCYVAAKPDPKATCGLSCNGQGDPISPESGGMYLSETDIAGSAAPGFTRFYNSIGNGSGELGPGWRHNFSRSVKPKYSSSEQLPYVPSADTSSLYNDEALACTAGFAEIKSRNSTWANATPTYSNGACTLTVGGTSIGAIPILYQSRPTPVPSTQSLTGYEVTRDTGQVITFAVNGTSITAPPGITPRLAQIAGGYTLTDSNDNVETYDATGSLLSITTRAGVVQTLSYTTAGRLAGVSDSFGHAITLGYDGQNRLASVTDAASHATQYSYDTQGRLETVTNTDGASHTFLYENAGFPNAITGLIDEASHRRSTWGYDTQGRATNTEEAGGANAVTLAYNTNGSVTATDALGAARTITLVRHGERYVVTGISSSQCPTCREGKSTSYNTSGFVTSRTDYNDNVTQYTNDNSRGLEVSRTEAYGTSVARTVATQWHSAYRLPTLITEPHRSTVFTHDTNGNVLTKTITDTDTSVSRTWTYTYNNFGRVLTEDGPRTEVSDVTIYAYYSCTTGYQCGRLHTVTNALGQVMTFNTYNALGQPLTITDPNGVVTTLAYDLRHRLISRQVGTETTGLTYWPTGLLKKVTLPDASFLLYTYDDAHRLTKIEDGEGNRIEYTLDAMGNRTAENAYDPSNTLARTRTQVFNSLSQLWKQVGATGTAAVTTTFAYDNNGNQTNIDAPLSRSTVSQYDERNRLKQITDPGSGITQFSYDANDNLMSATDPRNKLTSYTYNGFGDVTQQVVPDTGTSASTYDSGGNVVTRIDARSKTGTYSHDALNRVTSIAYPDLTTSFTYDSGTNGVGRLTGASDANHSLSFTYDAQGRVTGKSQTVGTLTKSVSYGYTNGNLTSITTPSGQAISYTYTQSRITGITLNGSTTILDQALYEPFGPVSGWRWGNGTFAARVYDLDGKAATIDSAGASDYGYDDAFRITSISDLADASKTWTYGYDTLDRLNSAAKTGQTIGYTYDTNGNRLGQTGTQTATYTISSDSNRISSITGMPSRTYSYDAAGNATGDGTNSYTYTDAGRLSSVTRSGVTTAYVYNALGQRVKKSNSSVTRYFMYDEAGHLLGEYDASGTLIEETVWLNDIPVATLRPNGSGVSLYYVHTDHLNTPRRISRPADNAIVWRWDSDPFGTNAPAEDPDGDSIAIVYNVRFPGQYFDAESGLNYNYFRDYDPAVGRYIESDPLGLSGGTNTYAYVDGNPISETDPTGEFGVVGAAIGGGLDLALQLIENGGNLRCVDFGSVLISAAIGAVAPGLGDTNKALKAARYARGAIQTLEGQLSRTASATRAAKIAQRIERNEKVLHDANSTVISKVTATIGGQIFKIIEAPTPLRIGNDCECQR